MNLSVLRDLPPPPTLTSLGVYSVGLGVAAGHTGIGVGTWQANNRIVYIPFWLPWSYVATSMFWVNGSTTTNNVDVGIYRDLFGLPSAQVFHTGSTAQSGTADLQQVACNVALPPGSYWFAIQLDSTVGSISRVNPSVLTMEQWGCLTQTPGTFGLPATATPVKAQGAFVPIMGMASVPTY